MLHCCTLRSNKCGDDAPAIFDSRPCGIAAFGPSNQTFYLSREPILPETVLGQSARRLPVRAFGRPPSTAPQLPGCSHHAAATAHRAVSDHQVAHLIRATSQLCNFGLKAALSTPPSSCLSQSISRRQPSEGAWKPGITTPMHTSP